MAKKQRNKFGDAFHQFANTSARILGTAWAFVIALIVIITWAVTGPLFHFSDTWQLVINTGTTIVTFLMVFLIQNTQNRDARAIHLKLDELLCGVRDARTGLVNLEELPEDELEKLTQQYKVLQRQDAARVNNLKELEQIDQQG